jgi:sarcosine oxidase subunit gamma
MRHSPLHDAMLAHGPTWAAVNGMPVAVRLAGEAASKPIRLADASCLTRGGVKGPQAEQWLHSQGIPVPEGVNSWTRTPDGAIVARLARSEFFLEDGLGAATAARARESLQPAPGAYPVLRQDAALVVAGARAHDLFAQTCNVNFRAWTLDQQTVVMTSMVGVSVLVLWHALDGEPCYRIWCDGTFGSYLWETLLDISVELGGGAVGLQSVFPQARAE